MLELLIAASMCVAYYFLVQKYAVGVADNSTNYWVFGSCSTSNFHLAQIYDVWKGRLAGMLFSGFLFDLMVKDNSLKIEQYTNIFALYQTVWLFLLFCVVIVGLRRSLLVNLGIFAGLIYNFSPASGFYFYPWDIPSTLFFTLAVLFFERRQFLLMFLAMVTGCFFKETVLVCALLVFFINDWKWWRRMLMFAVIGVTYVLGKKLLIAGLHLQVAALSMADAKDIHGLLKPDILIENIKMLFTPVLNHVAFVNAGTLVAVMILGWRRRFLPYMLVMLAFLGGQFMYGAFNEFRIFMQLLPLSMILLAERLPDIYASGTVPRLVPDERKGKNPAEAVVPLQPWNLRETFPVLTPLAILLIAVSVVVSAWQYNTIRENQRPDHQARLVTALKAKAERGDARAQFDLAKRYLSGAGVEINPTNAFQWLLKAASQGNAEAQSQLGVCYVQAIGTAQDPAAGAPWLRKAADQGNLDAQYNLGLLYENGLGVKQDLAEAAIWYQRAAEKGNVQAQNNLGMICFNFRKDYSEAAKWFRKAAESENALAENSLGVMYLQGQGVKQDPNEALKWFQKSGDKGFVEGQNNCAMLLFNSQRFSDAAKWFAKAADQGHVGAQFNLALMYQKGLGFPQDAAAAVLWYERAAKKGYGQAQLALGKIYHEGQGVKVDNVEAYKWFKLAQRQGVPGADQELANCAAAMSPEQISAAEAEAK